MPKRMHRDARLGDAEGAAARLCLGFRVWGDPFLGCQHFEALLGYPWASRLIGEGDKKGE